MVAYTREEDAYGGGGALGTEGVQGGVKGVEEVPRLPFICTAWDEAVRVQAGFTTAFSVRFGN